MVETSRNSELEQTLKKSKSRFLKKFYSYKTKVFHIPINIMVIIGCGVLTLMMLMMTADVIGRYIMRRPIIGNDEIVGFLLLTLTALGFAYSQREQSHIRIKLINEHLTARTQEALELLAYLLGFIITSLIAWQLFSATVTLLNDPETTEVLGILYSPFTLILGIGFSIFALVLLADMIGALILIKVGNK